MRCRYGIAWSPTTVSSGTTTATLTPHNNINHHTLPASAQDLHTVDNHHMITVITTTTTAAAPIVNTNYGSIPIYITENGVDVPGESNMPIAEALKDTFR